MKVIKTIIQLGVTYFCVYLLISFIVGEFLNPLTTSPHERFLQVFATVFFYLGYKLTSYEIK